MGAKSLPKIYVSVYKKNNEVLYPETVHTKAVIRIGGTSLLPNGLKDHMSDIPNCK